MRLERVCLKCGPAHGVGVSSFKSGVTLPGVQDQLLLAIRQSNFTIFEDKSKRLNLRNVPLLQTDSSVGTSAEERSHHVGDPRGTPAAQIRVHLGCASEGVPQRYEGRRDPQVEPRPSELGCLLEQYVGAFDFSNVPLGQVLYSEGCVPGEWRGETERRSGGKRVSKYVWGACVGHVWDRITFHRVYG